MSDSIDRLVKGAPPPNVSPEQVAANAKASDRPSSPPTDDSISPKSITSPIPPASNASHDPRDALPSSPPQIYLNLLILESSLRLQYLSLRARLRLHLLLTTLLIAWVLLFTYLLFFRPREDGSGVGGSVYWVLESAEKLGWCSGLVTSVLFWATGTYHRGVRWPRKFVSTTNRGLRGFNLKVVVVKGSFLQELAGWLTVLDPFGWLRTERVNFQVVPRDIETGAGRDHQPPQTQHWNTQAARHGIVEEDIAPGGDVLRVLLLPKPFSGDFREGWDNFRGEYWEKENARRASLRLLVRARQREVARAEGGWLWWTGWRGWQNVRFFTSRKSRWQVELEKLALREHGLKDRKRRESLLRDTSHSRTSSRSSTPDPDGRHARHGHADKDKERVRRGSSSHSTGSGPRRPRKGGSVSEKSRLSATETLLQGADADFQTSTRLKRLSMINTSSDDVKSEATSPLASRPLTPTVADETKSESAEA